MHPLGIHVEDFEFIFGTGEKQSLRIRTRKFDNGRLIQFHGDEISRTRLVAKNILETSGFLLQI